MATCPKGGARIVVSIVVPEFSLGANDLRIVISNVMPKLSLGANYLFSIVISIVMPEFSLGANYSRSIVISIVMPEFSYFHCYARVWLGVEEFAQDCEQTYAHISANNCKHIQP